MSIIFTNGFTITKKAPINNGLSAETAGTSAYQIKTDFPDSTDRLYWIKNDNIDGGTPFQIYADMTTLGGGWTLLVQNNYTDGWDLSNTLALNTTTPPSALVDFNSSGNPANNYSILGWADYIKRSASGFDYMFDAGFRGYNGAAYTANEAYSFTETWANQPVGTPFLDGNGFRKNITEISHFPAGSPGNSSTWAYDQDGIEARMPWYGTDNQGTLTTDGPGNNGWWGTIIATGGWDPAPWHNPSGWGSPRVIWYWVR